MALDEQVYPRIGRLRRQWARFTEGLSEQLWPLPVAIIVLAVIVGVLLPVIDRALDPGIEGAIGDALFSGGTSSARSVLSTVSTSLMTATSLTFSLTVVALQLASTQFSPRLLRLFARDKMVHATLATFLGTFAFAITVLRTVADEDKETAASVPRISVTVAVVLTMVSAIMLTFFLAHLARQLRVETMLRDVHHTTDTAIRLLNATGADGPAALPSGFRPQHAHLVTSEYSGFVTSIDRYGLILLASRYDIVLAEEQSVGGSVIAGVPIAAWWPRAGEPARDTVIDEEKRTRLENGIRQAYAIGFERTSSQDVGFGVRQLVDVACKALSPGVNDPTTAVAAIGHVSALVCAIANLDPEPAALNDDKGQTRLVQKPQDLTALVELALEQPRRYGAGDPVVVARLFQLLREFAYNHRDEMQAEIVRDQNDRLAASVADHSYDDVERTRFAGWYGAVLDALERRWTDVPSVPQSGAAEGSGDSVS